VKIHIEDFQSLGAVDIEATGLTVLVGKSNLGKSAVVRAVEAALFNRPGAEFVRTDCATALVEITGLPAADGSTLDVRWEKGKSVNRSTVNGEDYAKVGNEAPPPVQAAGYRDIKVGTEWLRPQVSGQFDPLFLLTRPGSFISDVLSMVSRLGVLLQADRACARDLKTAASELGIREFDLSKAKGLLAQVEGVPALRDRLAGLMDRWEQVSNDVERFQQAKRLLPLRNALRAAVALPVPPGTEVPPSFGDVLQRARTLAGWRSRLLPQVAPPLPEETVVPAALGAGWAAAAAQARRQAALASVKDLALPAALDGAQVEGAAAVGDLMVRVRGAAEWFAKARTLHHNAGVVLLSSRTDAEVAQAEVDAAFTGLGVCPLCDRPMGEDHEVHRVE
jgi:hypothetical protein